MELEGHETTHILVFSGRGRVQSVQRPETWSQSQWTPSHNCHTRPTWGQYYNVCCHFREWCEHTYSHIGPYNIQLILAFLNTFYRNLMQEKERGLFRPHLPNYVVVWNNVNFHRTNIVRDWFAAPYSPFLNPIEEVFFSIEVERIWS